MSLSTDRPVTYLITRGEATAENLSVTGPEILETITKAVEQGVSLVQIREKSLGGRDLVELARSAAAITSGAATKLLINDRADIASAAGADGVHLTSSSLPVGVVREKFPQLSLIGVSVHSIEAAKSAAHDGADLAVFAPIFATPGKGEPHGIEMLRRCCEELKPFPILALGGVDETTFRDVIAAGAAGFAAIRALNDAGTMRDIMQGLK